MNALYSQAVETIKRSTASLEQLIATDDSHETSPVAAKREVNLALTSITLAASAIAAHTMGRNFSRPPAHTPLPRNTPSIAESTPARKPSRKKTARKRRKYNRVAKQGIGIAHLDKNMLKSIVSSYKLNPSDEYVVTNKSRVADVALAIAIANHRTPAVGVTRADIKDWTRVLPQNQVPMLKLLQDWKLVYSRAGEGRSILYFPTHELMEALNA